MFFFFFFFGNYLLDCLLLQESFAVVFRCGGELPVLLGLLLLAQVGWATTLPLVLLDLKARSTFL